MSKNIPGIPYVRIREEWTDPDQKAAMTRRDFGPLLLVGLAAAGLGPDGSGPRGPVSTMEAAHYSRIDESDEEG